VTSASGAALHDVVSVLRRRAPGVELVVCHAAVQGATAPRELCAALDRVIRWGQAEVIIIGRGGGSREDLWAFNDERVARAVANCPVPTISAVGHEVDVSLCDLVADLRAATPSAAAEAVATSRDEIVLSLSGLRRRMVHAANNRLYEPRARAASAAHSLAAATSDIISGRRHRLGALSGRLNALSPLATLQRGYSVAHTPDGKTLASAADFTQDMPFVLRVRDGEVEAVARGSRTISEAGA
jgi:exodeoxyribonuclease VII large subunit